MGNKQPKVDGMIDENDTFRMYTYVPSCFSPSPLHASICKFCMAGAKRKKRKRKTKKPKNQKHKGPNQRQGKARQGAEDGVGTEERRAGFWWRDWLR